MFCWCRKETTSCSCSSGHFSNVSKWHEVVNIKHKVLGSAVMYVLWYTGWCKKGRWPVSVRNVPSIYSHVCVATYVRFSGINNDNRCRVFPVSHGETVWRWWAHGVLSIVARFDQQRPMVLFFMPPCTVYTMVHKNMTLNFCLWSLSQSEYFWLTMCRFCTRSQ